MHIGVDETPCQAWLLRADAPEMLAVQPHVAAALDENPAPPT